MAKRQQRPRGTVDAGQVRATKTRRATVCGLFAGVGGLEVGLHRAGFATDFLCEIDSGARAVLNHRFPGVTLHDDITTLSRLPEADVVVAGFPCQDLSMAGDKTGIGGGRSGLVATLLDLLRDARDQGRSPRWLVIENVPYMLHLQRGRAMREITDALASLGYTWAYRIVDARALGVPQRRLRVLLVASRTDDPRGVLFHGNEEPRVNDSTQTSDPSLAYGFYWTEGKRGLGWTVDSVPTIKGGSTLGIPSPPAIWIRETGEFGTPDIRDLERMQGLPENWTAHAAEKSNGGQRTARWRLVGNAVCGVVSEWLGGRLKEPTDDVPEGRPMSPKDRWPNAAWGGPGLKAYSVELSTWPAAKDRESLRDFLRYPLKPLSVKASRGYLHRASQATMLRFPEGFLESLDVHAQRMESAASAVSMRSRGAAAGAAAG